MAGDRQWYDVPSVMGADAGAAAVAAASDARLSSTLF
jgi:hypothetical protein